MKMFFVPVVLLFCSGCASQPYSAVAADAATTATGLSVPGIVEMNPLGWATVPLRVAVIEHAKMLPVQEGTPVLHMTSAVGWGATVNNLLIVAGAGPFAIVAGALVAVGVWQDGEPERQFWHNCAVHRALENNDALKCVWKE